MKRFLLILSIISGIFLVLSIGSIDNYIKENLYSILYLDIVAICIIVIYLLYRKMDIIKIECDKEIKYIKKICDDRISDFRKSTNKEIDKLNKDFSYKKYRVEKDYQILKMKLENEIKRKEERFEYILKSTDPYDTVSSLYADVLLYIYDESIYYLKHKKHPAIVEAKNISELKKETKMYIAEYREILYKYEFLLKTFPELKKYVDEYDTLKLLRGDEKYSEFISNRDNAIDYLSVDEWKKLGIDDRNQLALDRYKLRKKSNWVIGIEYEMYIDYLLRKSGYVTIPNGSLRGLEDLGRDIIAFKTDNNGNKIVYIIQCKNWASNKEIHENVVCQTFGTAVEYMIKHKDELFTKVYPVIYTTAPLSDMANEFAKRLDVSIYVVKKGEYPMIKCNISNDGNKIYHLPFDQQYYRTEIKKSGEFYAWTVKEAVNAGFRRAFKYSGNKSN